MSDPLSGLAAGLTSGNPISMAIGLGKDLIDKFIPDPALKAQAATHVLDLQAQLTLAKIDQENKVMDDASANAQSDHYLGRVRSTFCYMVIGLFAWNFAICRFFHQQPVDLPISIITCFTAILLGFIGIPAGIEMAKQVAAMPGSSAVSVLGLKVANTTNPTGAAQATSDTATATK